MKWLNCEKMRFMLIVFVAAIIIDGGSTKADFTFGEPIHLGSTINSSSDDAQPCISANGLELYFNSNRAGGYGLSDLWVSTRATIHDEWGTPANLGPTVNSPANDAGPNISSNGLELFFYSSRPGCLGDADLYVTTRTSIQDDWDEPINLGSPVNMSSGGAYAPSISADGLTLFFDSDRSGGYGGFSDIWVTTRATMDDPWSEAVNLGSTVNTGGAEISPCISADSLWLLFRSWRSGGQGNCDLWLSTRATTSDSWGVPVNLGPPVNSSSCEHDPSLSADGLTLFFGSNDRLGQLGGEDLWQAAIIPIVDFNDDRNVDTDDLLIMIDSWDTDNSLCDIGPMPWGDGVVDIEDLKVFIKYWEQENMPQETDDGE